VRVIKLVVTGPVQCGKSSYIKCLNENAMNVQVKGVDNKYYTVAMDLATIRLNGFDVFLFGTPGLLRFRVMRELICRGADGFIFIFDASTPEKDEDALSILTNIRKYVTEDVPIIYLANKQDCEDARTPEIIRLQNNLPENSKFFPTSSKTGLNIQESFKFLVNEVYDKYKEMLQLLLNYENDLKGLAIKLNKSREEIREFLNNLELRRFINIDREKKTYQVRKGLKSIST
jgi:small GTP-binding protein